VEIGVSPVELALESFRIGRETLPDLLRDISDIHLLETGPQSRQDRLRDGARRDLWWRHRLKPLVIDGPGEQVHHLDAAGRSSARRQCDSDRHAACEAE